jgi:SAM-dependent methyltransferase
MDAYTGFAQVYDLFMDNVPYRAWCAYICTVLRENGIEDGLVLDLGCGTGELTRLMAAEGYELIGVDASMDMLQEAVSAEENGEILYLLQQMQELDTGGSVRAVYSSCDCLNYLLEEDALAETFRRVYESLEPGGIFLFDMNTDYKYRTLLGEHTFAESREEGSFIWENYYDDTERVNEYDLTLFIPEKGELYRRETETHYQKNYDVKEVEALLARTGFALLGIYDDYTREPLRADSERATYICKK